MITSDTNVLVYLHDDAEPAKRTTAREIFAAMVRWESPIGLQVIGEFPNALRRGLKLERTTALTEARYLLEAFETFAPTRGAVAAALENASAGKLSYWDALLVASAAEAGARVLFSEDMQDGAKIMGVRIVNPFGAAGVLSPEARNVLKAT